MGFHRQEYWSGLPWFPPGDFPNKGVEPMCPALAGRYLTAEPLGKSQTERQYYKSGDFPNSLGDPTQLQLKSHQE